MTRYNRRNRGYNWRKIHIYFNLDVCKFKSNLQLHTLNPLLLIFLEIESFTSDYSYYFALDSVYFFSLFSPLICLDNIMTRPIHNFITIIFLYLYTFAFQLLAHISIFTYFYVCFFKFCFFFYLYLAFPLLSFRYSVFLLSFKNIKSQVFVF